MMMMMMMSGSYAGVSSNELLSTWSVGARGSFTDEFSNVLIIVDSLQ